MNARRMRGGVVVGKEKDGDSIYASQRQAQLDKHIKMLQLAARGRYLKPGSPQHEQHFQGLLVAARKAYGSDKGDHAKLATSHSRAYDKASTPLRKAAHAWLWVVHKALAE